MDGFLHALSADDAAAYAAAAAARYFQLPLHAADAAMPAMPAFRHYASRQPLRQPVITSVAPHAPVQPPRHTRWLSCCCFFFAGYFSALMRAFFTDTLADTLYFVFAAEI